jgi:hypothetical protein
MSIVVTSTTRWWSGCWGSGTCILRGTRRRKPSGVYKAILEAGELANLVAQMAEIGLFEVVYTDFRAFVRRWRQKGLPDAHYRSRQQGSIRLGCR